MCPRLAHVLFAHVLFAHVLFGCLPGLALDALAGVTDSLAFVRLRLTDLSNIGGYLADLLLVDAFDRDPGRRRDLKGNPVGSIHHHRVAKSEGELDLIGPFGGGPVTDPDDLEVFGETLRYTHDHVVDQATGQSV